MFLDLSDLDELEKLRYTVKLSPNVDARFVQSWKFIGEIIYQQATHGEKSAPLKHPHDDAYRAAEQLNILDDILMGETINKVRSDFSQITAQIIDGAMGAFGDFDFAEDKIKQNGGKYPKYTAGETVRRIRLARRPCEVRL